MTSVGRRGGLRLATVLSLVWAGSAATCSAPPTPARALVSVARPLGTWQGSGNSTIGVVVDSGRFRVHWSTQAAGDSGGRLIVTVHSAVSGRPMSTLIEAQGSQSGDAEFADDPRPYNLMVESDGLSWSIAVDEIVATPAGDPPSSRR